MEVSVNDTTNSRIQTFRRMFEFGTSHSSDFAPTSLGVQLIARQSTQLAELTSLLGTQAASDGAASQGTDLRANARDDLRSRLKRFSRTAHAIAIEVPGLENKFHLRGRPGNPRRVVESEPHRTRGKEERRRGAAINSNTGGINVE
jgi:hypothetical protein